MNGNLELLASKGFLTEADVLKLNKSVFVSNDVDASQLETAFDLAHLAVEGGVEWHRLFCDLCERYYLRREHGSVFFRAHTEGEAILRFSAGTHNPLIQKAFDEMVRCAADLPKSVFNLHQKQIAFLKLEEAA